MSKNKMQQKPPSEVVKIRVSPQAKAAIAEVASRSYRSFQDQVRYILDAWAAVNHQDKKTEVC